MEFTLKEKNLLPLSANEFAPMENKFFPFTVDAFSEGEPDYSKSQNCLLCQKMEEHIRDYPISWVLF